MGAIIQRGTKFYLRYWDSQEGRRTRPPVAARGCTTKKWARAQLNAIEKRIFDGKVGIETPHEPTVEELREQAEADRRRAITVKEIGDAFVERYTDVDVKDIAD